MTLSTKFRDNKAVYAGAGAVDLAVEKMREAPETVDRLRHNMDRYRDEVQEAMGKYRGEFRENVNRFSERVDAKDLPGAAVAYVTHAGTRAVEFIDELAERGKKVVNRTEAAAEEIEVGARDTTRRARTAVSGDGERPTAQRTTQRRSTSTARKSST